MERITTSLQQPSAMVNYQITGRAHTQPAHRWDQHSEHLLIRTHPQITVWVIVPDNPNCAWARFYIIVIRQRSLHFSDSGSAGFLSQPHKGVVSHMTSCTWFTNPHLTLSSSLPPPQQEDCLESLMLTQKFIGRVSSPHGFRERRTLTGGCLQSTQMQTWWEGDADRDWFSNQSIRTRVSWPFAENREPTLSVAVMHCSFICFR